MTIPRIAILGDGGWGTALALVLARKGISTTMWGAFPEYLEQMKCSRENAKFLPGITLPDAITFSADLESVVHEHTYFILAIPTIYLRHVLEKMSTFSLRGKYVISGVKGIEEKTFNLPSQIIHSFFPHVPLAVVSGPSHAEEVARAVPTCIVAAAEDGAYAKTIQELFMEARFRVYTSQDMAGVQLGGALKNVIAIAAGMCDGLGFGANTKAALLSRGLHEIVRLGVALGGRKETFFGLSGLGDLVTTCFSSYGRNRGVGERIAQGETITAILAQMQMVPEGVYTARSVFALTQKHRIDMPIATEVYRVLFEHKVPLDSMADLMMRDSKDEMTLYPGK